MTAVGALFVIVATGATVRLTGSGLGCEHWPGCAPGHPFPEKNYHSYIEFSNRLVGGLTIVLTLLAWAAATRVRTLPPWVPRLALLFTATGFALVVSGTFATAAGPHSGGDRVTRFGRLDVMLVVHAGAVAVFGLSLVFGLGYLAARRERSPRLFRLAAVLVGLVVVQMGLGELQYRTHLPWWLVLIHVSLAAGVWAWTVALVTLVRRPLASLAPART